MADQVEFRGQSLPYYFNQITEPWHYKKALLKRFRTYLSYIDGQYVRLLMYARCQDESQLEAANYIKSVLHHSTPQTEDRYKETDRQSLPTYT